MSSVARMNPPSPAAKAAVDDVVFAEIEELADKAASYWRSVREAAFRRERLTVAVHLKQVRLITLSTVQNLKMTSAEEPGETDREADR